MIIETKESGVKRVFWSGGWDSTFRILSLLVEQAAQVRPYYLIDPGRKSTLCEIAAMASIKKVLRERFPVAASRLRPTAFMEVDDVPAVPKIRESCRRLRKLCPVGIQYEWLAEFCESFALTDIELSFHNVHDPGLECEFMGLLRPNLVFSEGEDGRKAAVVDPDCGDDDIAAVFGHYRFPLLDMTKRSMGKAAEAAGFRDIMELTWFCHRPASGGKPCGTCAACSQVMQFEMKHRIPWQGRLRYYREKLLA